MESKIRKILTDYILGEPFKLGDFFNNGCVSPYLGPVRDIDDIVKFAMGAKDPMMVVTLYILVKTIKDKEDEENKRALEKVSLCNFKTIIKSYLSQ
jgi:hypothetical protein